MQKRSNSVAIGDVSISADHHILPARRNHPCFWDSDKVNKYEMVECTKCKKQIPFDNNAITVNNKVVGYFCWKCSKSILGDINGKE
jgi:predicted SprT family Zn-dependent metalloprotease